MKESPKPLLDIGPATAPAAAPRWADVRRMVIERQAGVCFACPSCPVRADHAPALDVIVAPNGDGYRAYCRGCRCKTQGPDAARKGWRTRREGRLQAELPGVEAPRVPADAVLVKAAVRRAKGGDAAAGARAMLGVLRRRGLIVSEAPR